MTGITTEGQPLLRQARRTDILSGFVVLSLIALLLSPLAVQRKVHGLRDEIQHAADPARTLVTEIQYLLARQTSVLRGYFISGDATSLRQFRELHAEELKVYEELRPLVERLGDRTLTHFVELRTLSIHWHERLDSNEVDSSVWDRSRTAKELPFEQTLYLAALSSAARLDEAIAEEARARREDIARAERWGSMVGAVLALLALGAATAAGYLSYRVRILAREAESRQALAEGALDAKNRAVLARTRLLRGITHDVKNPLGAADAYADLLQQGLKGPIPPAQLEFIGNIRHCLRAALAIVGDLLDLATAESGELSVESTPTSLGRLVAEVVEEYRGVVFRASHTLAFHVPAAMPEIDSDPNRIAQILSNLVSNAVKYTPPPGRIEVWVDPVQSRGAGNSQAWVAVRVADSGPGIPERHRETIFEEFSRLHLDAAEGHGLGLAISRKIARLLGGDVTIGDSAIGGAEFTLWLPADRAKAIASEREAGSERSAEEPASSGEPPAARTA
ncbi:MAG: hypothetical protein KY464_06025 [Gemmatimonadetes bacterium]|nr:hypothetical protein [Gemmatimonadota bacterium]